LKLKYSSNKTRTNDVSIIDCQKQKAVKSGEIPVGYTTLSQSHTFHEPTFVYVTANENVNSKIATLSFGIS